MLIVRCPLIPRKFCVNLFGVVLAKDTSWIDAEIVNHEKIHLAQMRETLFVGFYILYVLEWLVRLLSTGDSFNAYRSISFEREAYGHSSDMDYLKKRRHFAQWRR